MIDNALDCLGTQLENLSTSAMYENICNVRENIDPNVQQSDELLGAAKLKKKEVQPKKIRRQRTWLDKLHKCKRKPTKSPAPAKKKAKVKLATCTLVYAIAIQFYIYKKIFWTNLLNYHGQQQKAR